MGNTIKIIPLDRHAQLTDDLKVGCRETLFVFCEPFRTRDKKRNTTDMDKDTVEALVGFLTIGEVSFAELVMSHRMKNLGFWQRLTGFDRDQEIYAHGMAMQDLRQILAEKDSEPWNQDLVHFWRDLDDPFQELNQTDRVDVEYFFEMLMGKPYSDLVKNHYVTVSQESHIRSAPSSGEHAYIQTKYLTTPLREDCVLSLFSVVVGQETATPVQKPAIQKGVNDGKIDDSLYWPPGYDPQSGEEPPYLLPEIRFFDVFNPGVRHASLEAALDQAFSAPVTDKNMRGIDLHFMGSTLLTGTLKRKSFSTESITPPVGDGVVMDKSEILNAIKQAAMRAGLTLSLDDSPSIDVEP